MTKKAAQNDLRIPRVIFAHKDELISYFNLDNGTVTEYVEAIIKYAIEKKKKEIVLYEIQNVHYNDILARFIAPRSQWKSLLEKVIDYYNSKEIYEKSKEITDLIATI